MEKCLKGMYSPKYKVVEEYINVINYFGHPEIKDAIIVEKIFGKYKKSLKIDTSKFIKKYITVLNKCREKKQKRKISNNSIFVAYRIEVMA